MVDIGSDINHVMGEMQGIREEIERYKNRDKMFGPREILEIYQRVKELTKKQITLHPENRDRLFIESQLALTYQDRIIL